ncbi:autotransporter outer membrane beta-barrel domain-containing protein [Bosea sp. OAE752]|uniref:autotransporter outer membrane beta-barrel domain-containing protein n=1 Tax=Bosea sp. OAE752 TaxID=2663873 RepID=UPI003D223549
MGEGSLDVLRGRFLIRKVQGLLVAVDPVPVFDGETIFRHGVPRILGGIRICRRCSLHSARYESWLSSSESDNYHLGLYGGGQWGPLGLRLGASYTWHDIETRRSVVAAGLGTSLRADHDAGTAQVFGELGYRIDLGPVAFEPFAGLAYVSLRSDGLSEVGGAAALSGTSDDTSLGYSTLGLRASTSTRIQGMDLSLRGALGWRHAFGDVDPKATLAFAGSIPFTITGAPIARNAALVEAGLDLAISANASLGVTYAGQLAEDVQDHAFKANLAVRF